MSRFDLNSPEFNQALAQASSELGMPDYYMPCVRPLFTMPMQQWPMCCGGSCEPCAQTLVTVASRMCELLNIDPDQLP
ncbi:MAG: hypothetical protein AB7F79_05470 [Steroidobacteraceae bacterium]